MKIKYFFFSATGFFLAALCAAFLSQGCVESIPPLSAVVATATPTLAPNVISDFENGSTAVNPNLQNGDEGYWRAGTYGGAGGTIVSGGVTTITSDNAVNNPFVVPNTVPDATDSSGFTAHLFAPLINVGAYESDQLVCFLNRNTANPHYPYYNTPVSFTGIQFLINIPADDTNDRRVFQVVIDQTLPASETGGACAPTTACSCYNHFEVVLPAGSTGGWTTVGHPWTDFTVPSCSGSVTPAGLENHLDKIIFLQFQFGSSTQGTPSGPVSTYTNFWVDDVRFLP